MIKKEGGGQRERSYNGFNTKKVEAKRKGFFLFCRTKRSCWVVRSLTWIASGALGERVGQVGQLAYVVAVLQRAHVHVVPPAELAQPQAPLFAFGVGIEHDAHPQGTCRDPDTQVKKPSDPRNQTAHCPSLLSAGTSLGPSRSTVIEMIHDFEFISEKQNVSFHPLIVCCCAFTGCDSKFLILPTIK